MSHPVATLYGMTDPSLPHDREYFDEVVTEYGVYSRAFAEATATAAVTGTIVLLLIGFVGWITTGSPQEQRVTFALPRLSGADYFALIGVAVAVVIALQLAVRGAPPFRERRPRAAQAGRDEFLARAAYAVGTAVFMVCATRMFGRPFDGHVIDLGRFLLEPAVALVVMLFAADVAAAVGRREAGLGAAWVRAKRRRQTGALRELTAGTVPGGARQRLRDGLALASPLVLAALSGVIVGGGDGLRVLAWLVLAAMWTGALCFGVGLILRFQVSSDRIGAVFGIAGLVSVSMYLFAARILVLLADVRDPGARVVAVLLVAVETIVALCLAGWGIGVGVGGRRRVIRELQVAGLARDVRRRLDVATGPAALAARVTVVLVPSLGVAQLQAGRAISRGGVALRMAPFVAVACVFVLLILAVLESGR